MTTLRLFRDGSRLEFGKGHLDQWSVYLAHPHQGRAMANDQEGLARLERLALAYSPRTLYDDFIVIYNRTTHEPQPYVFDLIHTMARVYSERDFEVEVAMAMLYAVMVSRERRHRSCPGKKRHQRLAVHQLLVEGYSAQAAIAFSSGKADEQLADACEARGF